MTDSEYGNPRQDPALAVNYQKDGQAEAFLADLNSALEPLDSSLLERPDRDYPTLFILGLPRSGTTLLSQMLATFSDLGYISNLSACFWRTPRVGIYLAKKVAADRFVSSFAAKFGRTTGAQEPHEFGYFWSSQLGYTELLEPNAAQRNAIDWRSLVDTVQSMSAITGRPFFFKNVLLNWHVEDFYNRFPGAYFIWIRRNRVSVARSLARMREEFLGSREFWVSAKPKNFTEVLSRPYWEQIAYQICCLEGAISHQLAALPGERRIELQLEDLITDPVTNLSEALQMLGNEGARVEMHPERLAAFEPIPEKKPNDEQVAEIEAAFERIGVVPDETRK